MSYLQLGRAEDPSFTIKVANVIATMAGRDRQGNADQVADLIEKKLQELPYFDKIDTYTKPGFHGDAGDVQGHHAALASALACFINCARNWATCTAICRPESIGPTSTTNSATSIRCFTPSAARAPIITS